MFDFTFRDSHAQAKVKSLMESLDSSYNDNKGDIEYIFRYINYYEHDRLYSALRILRTKYDIAKVYD